MESPWDSGELRVHPGRLAACANANSSFPSVCIHGGRFLREATEALSLGIKFKCGGDKGANISVIKRDNTLMQRVLKISKLDFPGGTVVKNPPANAGNTGSSPGPGRSHMPRCN